MIASFGMALRYSFDMGKQADMIDAADGDSGAQVDDGWLLAE